jgi:hypothetical protein
MPTDEVAAWRADLKPDCGLNAKLADFQVGLQKPRKTSHLLAEHIARFRASFYFFEPETKAVQPRPSILAQQ